MDRVNLILEALASNGAGADTGASDEATSAYADLKGLVKRRFGGRADAEMALEQYEEKPGANRERLMEMLDSTGVVEDFEIVGAAQKVLKLVDPEGAVSGKYAVQPRPLPGPPIGH
ncbi:MAG: hypothetical protein ACR2J6_01150 [Thermoleophilaceae bacterium]